MASKKGNLHALLVGIDTYHPESGVPKLSGCENDVVQFESFLIGSYQNKHNLHVKSLINEQATYHNVINHFREDFLQRKDGKNRDFIIFYYSGHGARQRSAPEFSWLSPDGMEETLVLYDSRIPKDEAFVGNDLADKEIAVLLNELNNDCSHVLVILDCCHSGSGTKDIEDITLGSARQIDERIQPKPIDRYLYGYYTGRFGNQGNIQPPESSHLLIAACGNNEKAYELPSKKGLFTTSLLKILKGNNLISYADLITRCRISMRTVTKNQNPQLEPSKFFNAYNTFLQNEEGANQKSYILYKEKDHWWVNCGALHGLSVDNDRGVEFAIYDNDQHVGFAITEGLGIQKSIVKAPDLIQETSNQYQAKLIKAPSPAVLVKLETDQHGGKLLEDFSENQKPVHFQLVPQIKFPRYLLRISKGEFQIINGNNDHPLRIIVGNDNRRKLENAFGLLSHLAQWQKTLQLKNKGPKFPADSIEIVLKCENEEIHGSFNHQTYLLQAAKTQDRFSEKLIDLEIYNNSNIDVFCCLYYLSPDFGTHFIKSIEVSKQSKTIALYQEKLALKYPETETTDIFKLIFSLKRIDDFLLSQEMLPLEEKVEYWLSRGTLQDKLVSKDLVPAFQKKINSEDWFTKTILIKMLKNIDKIGKGHIALGRRMNIDPHPSFRATLSLINIGKCNNTDFEPASALLRLIIESGAKVISFEEVYPSPYNCPNAVFLGNIENRGSLENIPLNLYFNSELKPEETIRLISFDGENIIAFGKVNKLNINNIHINITNIPLCKGPRNQAGFIDFSYFFIVKSAKAIPNWIDLHL